MTDQAYKDLLHAQRRYAHEGLLKETATSNAGKAGHVREALAEAEETHEAEED
jgi:hypothetical protein